MFPRALLALALTAAPAVAGEPFALSADALSLPGLQEITTRDPAAPYRVGVNMLRTLPTSPGLATPAEVLADVRAAGGQGLRQVQAGDVGWFALARPGGGPLDFAQADPWLLNDQGLYPIPTLYQIGPAAAARFWGGACPAEGASPDPHCREPFTPDGVPLDLRRRDVRAAASAYVTEVARHYQGSGLHHYEVMNEPERFRHHDLGLAYTYRWGPRQYARLLTLTRAALRAVDPEAVVVAGGAVWYDQHPAGGRQEMWEDYLDTALAHGAAAALDVVNVHYYGPWPGLAEHLGEARALMAQHGIAEKPLWLTEVGSSATSGSPGEQAADIFRYLSVAFGEGVALVNWHTHLSSTDAPRGWGGYGLRQARGRRHPAWYAFRLFASKLGNFGTCAPLARGAGGVWAYRYSGALHPALGTMTPAWVLWSSREDATYDLGPELLTEGAQVEVIQVVPDARGYFSAHTQPASEPIALGPAPVLVLAR
ncbi:MAG: cellulase family glycosylhydrolase [Pseudomonadota bacterium]